MRFSYETEVRYRGDVGLYILSWPVISIRAIGPSDHVDLKALVDTGSTDTLLPLELMDVLGVPEVYHDEVSGVGGPVNVFFGRINLELAYRGQSLRWSTMAGFHAGYRTLLGHNGFLQYFGARFNGQRQFLTLTPDGTRPDPVEFA